MLLNRPWKEFRLDKDLGVYSGAIIGSNRLRTLLQLKAQVISDFRKLSIPIRGGTNFPDRKHFIKLELLNISISFFLEFLSR